MLELEDPYSGWTSHDYRLLEAIAVLDRDTCKTCGSPAWLCHTTLGEVQFEIHSGFCYADAELQDYKDMPGSPELEKGEYIYPVAVGLKKPDGTYEPLPSRREALASMASTVKKSE